MKKILLFTTLILLPFVLCIPSIRTQFIHITAKEMLIMSVIGIILALHFTFWITSLNYTSVASSVILVTSHPILVAPLSFFLLKEHISKISSSKNMKV